MLAGTAAPEIFPADHDGKLRIKLTVLHEACRIERVRQAAHRVAAEFLVFVRNRRYEGQILRRDNLVRVDIIAHHINRTRKNRLHEANLAGQGRVFNQNMGANGAMRGC